MDKKPQTVRIGLFNYYDHVSGDTIVHEYTGTKQMCTRLSGYCTSQHHARSKMRVFVASTRQLIKSERNGYIMEKESLSMTPEIVRHVMMEKGFQNVSRIGRWRF